MPKWLTAALSFLGALVGLAPKNPRRNGPGAALLALLGR